MPVTQIAWDDRYTYGETIAAAAKTEPHAFSGDILIQATQGSTATTLVVERHPAFGNKQAPAANSPDWAPYTTEVVTVDAAVGVILLLTEPAVGYYRVKADKTCKISISGAL